MLEKMVPRDGVEPPTPAFSGPDRFEVMWLALLDLPDFRATEITTFLEQ